MLPLVINKRETTLGYFVVVSFLLSVNNLPLFKFLPGKVCYANFKLLLFPLCFKYILHLTVSERFALVDQLDLPSVLSCIAEKL